jgi:hypothetical protein
LSMKDIKDLTAGILGNLQHKQKDRETHWEELLLVVEEEWKNKIVNLGYERGCLQLGVNTSVSLQEVQQFHKNNWLTALKKTGSKVKEIRVKLIDELGDQ